MTYRVAMVGCGRVAGFIDREVEHYPAIKLPYSHAAAYALVPETEIVACCATRRESVDRFQQKWNVPHGYLDYREMIEKETPDIISICTHAPLHAEIAIFAANAGVKGIYCEKAMARSLAEADAMIDACERNGVVMIVGHLRRWHNRLCAVRDHIASGALGELRAMHTIHDGLLFHTGSHNFDLIHMFARAEPEFAQARIDSPGFDRAAAAYENDAEGVGFIRFRNGVTAFVHARHGIPPLFDQELICEGGVIRIMNNGTTYELWTMQEVERPHFDDGPVWEDVPRLFDLQKAALPIPDELESMQLAAVRDLVHAIATGERPACSMYEGRTALELAVSFVESERQGGARVHFPIADREIVVDSR